MANQVWAGNIPWDMDEAGILLELSAYGVRPLKAVHRTRGRNDGFAVLTFASAELAAAALVRPKMHWHNGSFILLRYSYLYIQCVHFILSIATEHSSTPTLVELCSVMNTSAVNCNGSDVLDLFSF